jgi:adenosylcobinamide-phosphate guanylyltransferase
MIKSIIQALYGVEKIDSIIVATTKYTPKTEEYIKNEDIKIIRTPGEGYVSDLRFIISKFNSNEVLLTITADLPLIKSSTLDYVIDKYENCGKDALCVAVHPELFRRYNLKPSWQLKSIIPSGLNILRSINMQQDEEVLLINEMELALNINSQDDIKFLEEHLSSN